MDNLDYVALIDFKDQDNANGKNSVYNMLHRIVKQNNIKVTMRYLAVSIFRKARTLEQERPMVTVDRLTLIKELKRLLKIELDNPSNHPRQAVYIDRMETMITVLGDVDVECVA